MSFSVVDRFYFSTGHDYRHCRFLNRQRTIVHSDIIVVFFITVSFLENDRILCSAGFRDASGGFDLKDFTIHEAGPGDRHFRTGQRSSIIGFRFGRTGKDDRTTIDHKTSFLRVDREPLRHILSGCILHRCVSADPGDISARIRTGCFCRQSLYSIGVSVHFEGFRFETCDRLRGTVVYCFSAYGYQSDLILRSILSRIDSVCRHSLRSFQIPAGKIVSIVRRNSGSCRCSGTVLTFRGNISFFVCAGQRPMVSLPVGHLIGIDR